MLLTDREREFLAAFIYELRRSLKGPATEELHRRTLLYRLPFDDGLLRGNPTATGTRKVNTILPPALHALGRTRGHGVAVNDEVEVRVEKKRG